MEAPAAGPRAPEELARDLQALAARVVDVSGRLRHRLQWGTRHAVRRLEVRVENTTDRIIGAACQVLELRMERPAVVFLERLAAHLAGREPPADEMAQARRDLAHGVTGAPGGEEPKGPAQAAAVVPGPAQTPAAGVAPEAGPVAEAQPAPSSAPEFDEPAHWREVYDEFLRVHRELSSERGADEPTWEQFQAVLTRERTKGMSRFGGRAIRFSVEVRKGKAALKGVPVRR